MPAVIASSKLTAFARPINSSNACSFRPLKSDIRKDAHTAVVKNVFKCGTFEVKALNFESNFGCGISLVGEKTRLKNVEIDETFTEIYFNGHDFYVKKTISAFFAADVVVFTPDGIFAKGLRDQNDPLYADRATHLGD